MPRGEPSVSVCIPTYNRAGMLRESIESVLAQSFEDYELIVSDNASEDETEEVVRSYNDRRIQYTRNDRNIGQQDNWNRCFSLARGEYIAPLPDDDLMLPENLEEKVAVLSKSPEAGLVHSKYHVIDGEGRIVKCNTTWGHGPDRTCDQLEPGREVVRRMLLGVNTINLPTVVFRRACYQRFGGFTDELRLVCDWEYWMRIGVYYDIAFLARPLVKWRFHAGTATNRDTLTSDRRLTDLALWEALNVRRLIVNRYLDVIGGGRDFRRSVWRRMGEVLSCHAEGMVGEGGPNPEARNCVLKMCWQLPGLLGQVSVWKVLVKSMVRRGTVQWLKRVVPTRWVKGNERDCEGA